MFSQEMMNMLEYPAILERLCEHARTGASKARILALVPMQDPDEIARRSAQTQSARKIYDAMGTPPIHAMEGLGELGEKLRIGATLSLDDLRAVAAFLNHCRLLRRYMERAMTIDPLVAAYGLSIDPLTAVQEEIERCIRGDQVVDHASPQLRSIRIQRQQISAKIKDKLTALLRAHPDWFQESFYSQRGGRYVLPVKRECRQQVKGSVLDASASGATVFVEPTSVQAMQQQADLLAIDEENEVYRILAGLSAQVAVHAQPIRINSEAMADIDFAFACGRLGSEMGGVLAAPTRRKELVLTEARHPLLGPGTVPLTVQLGQPRGLIITGPNTGGKTVSIKTVGLLTLMALSGLLVPAREAVIPLFSGVYCDIGDGQSLSQNLSTFSSHVKRVVRILGQADGKSLVLLDELGSGTDPQEGMGLAVAVLEELGRRSCLIMATSHYPEIKVFAANTPGFANARMTFDRVTLTPLYRLEMGAAGESCALYIAKRLGISDRLLERAWQAAYPDAQASPQQTWEAALRDEPKPVLPQGQSVEEDMPMPTAQQPGKAEPVGAQYRLGDAVLVPFMNRHGIVAQVRNARGEVTVRIQGKNYMIPEKRLKPFIPAEQLYPDGEYDLDIVLDTLENRRAKHAMDKGKIGEIVRIKEGK